MIGLGSDKNRAIISENINIREPMKKNFAVFFITIFVYKNRRFMVQQDEVNYAVSEKEMGLRV